MRLIADTLAIAGIAAALVAIPAAFADHQVAAPAPAATTTTTTHAPPAPAVNHRARMEAGVATTTTTTTTIPAGDWRCPQWIGLALETGFPADELATVDRLLWRESRCNPDAYNGDDPNGGSRGLMQVNGIWCEWYMQSLGILAACDDLFDPAVNLRAALAIRHRQGGYAAWGI
jgi:hypothetical protein